MNVQSISYSLEEMYLKSPNKTYQIMLNSSAQTVMPVPPCSAFHLSQVWSTCLFAHLFAYWKYGRKVFPFYG